MRILGPTPPRLPIGHSDYVELRRAGHTYVDKTAFVAHLLDGDAKVKLYPRPRRFGKTLNLSTARHFLERGAEDLTELFADTEIWDAEGGRHRAHFQRHPVIWLTFKDVKHLTWDETLAALRRLLQDELVRLWRHHDLARHFAADAAAFARFDVLCRADAPTDALTELLAVASRWCAEATGEPVVILIDEYDAALHAAWQHGYWDEAVSFFRALLSAGLKDNAHLLRGALTGILRVAKGGARGSGGRPPAQLGSGLNNVRTFGLLNAEAATHFGFTETEVEALAHAHGLGDRLPEIARWYNGYRFGGAMPHTLYNPWSLIQYLTAPEDGFLPYWKNSSGNELIHQLLLRQAAEVGPQIERLLAGDTVTVRVDENVALSALRRSPTALWSLLLFSGYLTAETLTTGERGQICSLRLPNREVAQVYQTTFTELVDEGGPADEAPPIAQALLTGDTEAVGAELERLLLHMLSHHDLGARPVEAVYQAFILGLLVSIAPTHRVVSNREAGHGRADVLISPKQAGAAGAVLELKVVNPRQAPEAALAAAVAQLRDRCYHTEVRAAGAGVVHQYAVVFDGKRCWVEPVPEAG